MNYLELNKAAWNDKTAIHLQSDFYDLEGFKAGRNSLNPIELALLGDVRNKKILHLQCHFGQDSLSLARMGAKVTGVDLSDASVDAAKALNAELGLDATFLCCDVYSLKEQLDEQFDIVFTSYGTIGWLPDLERWADVIQHFLKPGGQLVFAEFHPVVWMMDDEFEAVAYSYFQEDAIIEDDEGTYTDRSAEITNRTVSWNHGLAEVYQALKSAGLTISDLKEYDYSPYPCFKGVVERTKGEWIIEKHQGRLPMVYSLLALKC